MKKLGIVRKLILPLVIGIAVAGGLTVYTIFVLPNVLPAVAQAGGNQVVTSNSDKDKIYPGPVYAVKERVVNLADPSARRYLKIGISLEFATKDRDFQDATGDARKKKEDDFNKELAPRGPVIDDAITTILSSKTVNDLSTTDGKEKLKSEIKDRLNSLLAQEKILNVYLTEFIIQ